MTRSVCMRRVDPPRIQAARHHPVAHGGQIDQQRNAAGIGHQHASRIERQLAVHRVRRRPARQSLDVAAVTAWPSSLRSRFSSSTRRANGSRSRDDTEPFRQGRQAVVIERPTANRQLPSDGKTIPGHCLSGSARRRPHEARFQFLDLRQAHEVLSSPNDTSRSGRSITRPSSSDWLQHGQRVLHALDGGGGEHARIGHGLDAHVLAIAGPTAAAWSGAGGCRSPC